MWSALSARDVLLDAAFRVLQAAPALPRPDDVAREAGTSKALVFHHFGSVQGLHDAMAERVLVETQRGLDALAADYPEPRARLEALARALLAEPPEAPAVARRVARFWLSDEARASGRDALLADFVAKTLREGRIEAPRLPAIVLARWHGATLVYANGGSIDFDDEAERLVAEIDRETRKR